MEEDESAPVLSRKELRKQKLMEYLAAKGKLKPPAVRSLQEESQRLKPLQKGATGKENKVPADKVQPKGSKGQTFTAGSSQDPLRRRPFGVSDHVNVKGSALNRNKTYSSSSSASAPLRLYQTTAITKTSSAVSSKSSVTSAVSLKKQTNTRSQTSVKAPSNAAQITGIKSNPKSRCGSSSVASCPLNTAASRISLGPLVLTKTGLTPAVTQPRNTKSHVSHATAHKSIATTSVSKKEPSSTSAPVSLSQRFTNSRAKGDVQAQNKSKPKALLNKTIQPTCKSQISGGLRSASASFKCKAPGGKTVTSKSAGQPAETFKKDTSVAEGVKRSQLSRAAPQTSSKTSRFCPAVVTELRGKSKDTHNKTEKSSARFPPPQKPAKPTAAPVMSRTEPQPVRSISITGRTTDTKTLKAVPQTEGKKGSAAQEERVRKLQAWREAKGISYKRPSMPVNAAVGRAASGVLPIWGSKDEAQSLISAMDQSLADCIKLLAEGCPPGQVKEILTRLPAVSQKFAKYWICRARLMEQEGHLDVLPMFEEAVRVVLEPVDELRAVVFDILRRKDEIQENSPDGSSDPLMTPKPVRVLINGERGDSSVIKYKITRTPGGPPSQQREPVQFNGQEVRFFTPVRRSVRIERVSLRYPPSLQDQDVCVSSFSDLIAEEDADRSRDQKDESRRSVKDDLMYVYRENEALGDKVSVRFVREDDV